MYLKEIGWEGLDASGSGKGPVADYFEHGNELFWFHKRQGI
jgi:hypothetical protein